MNLNEISLKWNGFQNNIICNVKELFQDEGLSDVTLVSDGHCFKAHKVILSACSPLFKGIFQQNPYKDPIIVLHDVNIASIKTLLTFMYSGEVNVTEEFLPILLKAANSLKIRGLSTAAESNVEKKAQSPPKKRKKWDNWPIVEDKKAVSKKSCTRHFDDEDIHVDLPVIPEVELLEPLCEDIDSDSTPSPLQTHSPFGLKENINSNGFDNLVSNIADHPIFSKVKDSSIRHSPSPIVNDVNHIYEKENKGIKIEDEIENVLQSGGSVESLNIASVKLNSLDGVSNDKTSNGNGTSYANPVFPCPFCPRIYNSWGYRRRHVKSRHDTSRLPCKWCCTIHHSQAAWYAHTTRAHGVTHEDARNSLVVMVEAHAVLTLDEPSLPALLGQVRITQTDSTAATNKSEEVSSNGQDCVKSSVMVEGTPMAILQGVIVHVKRIKKFYGKRGRN